jgi:hypothetical protein
VSVRSIVTGANKRTSFLRLVDEPSSRTNEKQREDDAYACGPDAYDSYRDERDGLWEPGE